MSAEIRLPGRQEPLLITEPDWARGYPPPVSRSVYAAAHVAARPGGEIDWESTLSFRDFLWDYGFGVAEAMDTAQRGMGLPWAQARELITRSAARAAERGAVIAAGAGTDQLPPGPYELREIVTAYEQQLGAFAAVTAPAAAALHALDAGDLAGYDAAIGPTMALSRKIFEPPTFHYKVGVAFLAWLNGLQPHFAMLDGLQEQRTPGHLTTVFELAARAGALLDPDLAVARMTGYLAAAARP